MSVKYIPSHLNIETVNRMCNARCPMCPIKFIPEFSIDSIDEESHTGFSRLAEIMPLERFKEIIDKFVEYKDEIKFINLHGCGEPLLDKTLAQKVAYVRSLGFKNVGFTSNCDALTKANSKRFLEAGLTCIIPSIDGFTKETHEKIRPGTNFERIVRNVNYFIEARNELGLDCKVVIRMIKQQDNEKEWESYKSYWGGKLNPTYGDMCVDFEVHNTGGKVEDYDEKRLSTGESSASDFLAAKGFAPVPLVDLLKLASPSARNSVLLDTSDVEQRFLCPDLFSRLHIFASGRIGLCSADQAEYHPIGSILDFADPIDAFNSEIFEAYRGKWLSRDIASQENCSKCTVVVSRFLKHKQKCS